MWKRIIPLGLIGLLVSGCAFTPRQLNANPGRYSGETVVVRGFIKLSPETHVLYESRALYDEFQRGSGSGSPRFDARKYEKYCVTIANPELLYKNRATVNAETIVIQGKFIDNYLNGKTVELGACPLPTAIFIDNASLARRYRSLLPRR